MSQTTIFYSGATNEKINTSNKISFRCKIGDRFCLELAPKGKPTIIEYEVTRYRETITLSGGLLVEMWIIPVSKAIEKEFFINLEKELF